MAILNSLTDKNCFSTVIKFLPFVVCKHCPQLVLVKSLHCYHKVPFYSAKDFLSKHFQLWTEPDNDIPLSTLHGVVVALLVGLWLYPSPKMGKNCIDNGWSNSHWKGYPLFEFPKDSKLRRAWTLQIQGTRDGWKGITSTLLCAMNTYRGLLPGVIFDSKEVWIE